MSPKIAILALACLPLSSQAMPSLTVLQQAITANPEWQVAARHVDVAYSEARLQAESPHEWQVGLTTQQRRYSTTGNVQEWTVRVERGWRLPSKTRLDQAMAATRQQKADFDLADSRLQLVQEAFNYWLDSAGVQAQQQLLQQQITDLQSFLQGQEKQVLAGELARREVVQTQTALAALHDDLLRLQGEQALADEALEHHYPLLVEQDKELPAPQAVQTSRESVAQLAIHQPSVKAAQLETQLAQDYQQRVDAERYPDPVLGIFTSQEAIPNERVLGVSMTMPLAGKRKQLQRQEAANKVSWQTAEQNRVLQNESHTNDILWLQQDNAYTAWQESLHHVALATQAATMAQKAYLLGEGSLAEATQARQQQFAIQQQELTARLLVIRAQELLRIRQQGY